MLHKLVLLSVIGVAIGQMGGKMMMKYAHMSMMQECMGPEPMDKWMKEFMAASMKCEQQGLNETDTKNIDFQAVINEIRRNAVPWGSKPKSSSNMGANMGAQFFPVPMMMVGGRMKRQSMSGPAMSAAQKLEMMKSRMTTLIGNATCVLKEVGWLNEDKSVNYEKCKEWITDLNIDESLREDLLYAHDCCKDLSMCMPVEKAKNPILKEFGQTICYQGCMKKKTVMCCAKQNFKKMALEMGMDNVDSAMDMGMGMMGMSDKAGPSNMDFLENMLSGEMMF